MNRSTILIDEIIDEFFFFRSVQYHADFVGATRDRSTRGRTFIRIPFAMRGHVRQRMSKEPLLKSRWLLFSTALRQFDFVFRHGRPVLPSLFLRRVVSSARRSKFYGSYFLFNADAVSGTPDDSTRLCVRLPPSPLPTSLPSPSVLYLSPSFPSFTAYRLFARAIVSRRVVVSRRSTDVYDRLSGESGVRANPVDGSNPPDIYCRHESRHDFREK